MLRVGLTGGLASGKSFVGSELERLGCYVIRADRLGHEALAQGGEAYSAVIREFGTHLLDESGAIRRRVLAQEVFDHPERLALLNDLIHPAVIRREEEMIDAAARRDPDGISVVEAAILIETGRYKRFDRMIVVFCSEELQVRRAMERDGFTEKEARSRLSRQMPLEEKRAYADYLIDTSGSEESTLLRTQEVYRALLSIPRGITL